LYSVFFEFFFSPKLYSFWTIPMFCSVFTKFEAVPVLLMPALEVILLILVAPEAIAFNIEL